MTGASANSPSVAVAQPDAWPPNFNTGFVDYVTLKRLYAGAKAIIASDTEGLRGVVELCVTGRARLGANARLVAEQRYGLDTYTAALAEHFLELAGESSAIGSRR